MKQIQQQKANEEARRLRDKLRYERKMEEERAKEREILKKRMAAELNKKQCSFHGLEGRADRGNFLLAEPHSGFSLFTPLMHARLSRLTPGRLP